MAKTISEKILSAKSGTDARAGDIVVCEVDLVVGTDASSPMAIDYFEKMGGDALFDPSRVVFSLDHYAPPTAKTQPLHDRIHAFALPRGATVFKLGDGISHQLVGERGLALPGDLIVGADSHTVTLGALDLFATGVGSSDLAAAMMAGKIWLRVPETIRVELIGERPASVAAKDVALEMIRLLGADGANYQTLEFHGAIERFTLEERLVLSNLAVEADAKAAIFPFDAASARYLAGRTAASPKSVGPDPGARYSRTLTIDLSTLGPRVAVPHSPNDVRDLAQLAGTPIHMVFIGTCTGGRVSDVHDALAVLDRSGGRVAPNVQLVVTPASEEVRHRLADDGSLAKLESMGAIVTTPGCGACCGTSGVIPADGMNVLSTANRNFKARMGNATAEIYLASPAACAAAAVTGAITDPASL